MRFFLIPISTRRAFVYCRSTKAVNTGILDRITTKAANTWAGWERADKGWKKTLVGYGHVILQRIPYEEWGLKSIPPLNSRRQIEESRAKQAIDVMFPGNAIKPENVLGVLRELGTKRQEEHRRKMWWCLGIAPLTAPIALIPIIPNVPFFYLAYRGWSHWRAWSGSKHLVHLLDNNLLNPHSSAELVSFYQKRLNQANQEGKLTTEPTSTVGEPGGKEKLLLEVTDGKELGEVLQAPEITIEVERAVLQIRQKLKAEATAQAGDTKSDSNTSDEKKDS